MINLIVAIDDKHGMADETGIPWQGKLPTDIKFFRDMTKHAVSVMGYRTYQELKQPLSDRRNLVIARPGTELRDGFELLEDFDSFLQNATEDIEVIGGAQVFAQTIKYADNLYITRVTGDFNCTKFFPPFEDDFKLVSEQPEQVENGIPFRFQVWQPKQPK